MILNTKKHTNRIDINNMPSWLADIYTMPINMVLAITRENQTK